MGERREFVMLAHPYNPKRHVLKGWLYSEKMDGMRALWDGGISRGLYKSDVPWANNDRDERYVERQVATGLWSRYGNIIHAPEWFLNQLPDFTLDGELFTERKSWQTLSSTIKKIVPVDDAWQKVTYNVFDSPPYTEIFATGLVNSPNYIYQFDVGTLMEWTRPRAKVMPRYLNFAQVSLFLENHFGDGELPNVRPVKQTLLESVDDLDNALQSVLDLGGEGLIVRNPKSYWEPKRSHQQVKIKDDLDDEATVVGYIWGRETDKGSKLMGLMGALVVDYKGKRLELSGFTDAERRMSLMPFPDQRSDEEKQNVAFEGEQFPGQKISRDWINTTFPIGSVVTFKYRELSDTGIPKEARFWRKRPTE